jgi:E3 ubiquitin-protein ligase TTC3
MLEKFVEECKFPPVPDAVCCYQKCRGYSKIQIYLTDPDFKVNNEFTIFQKYL